MKTTVTNVSLCFTGALPIFLPHEPCLLQLMHWVHDCFRKETGRGAFHGGKVFNSALKKHCVWPEMNSSPKHTEPG